MRNFLFALCAMFTLVFTVPAMASDLDDAIADAEELGIGYTVVDGDRLTAMSDACLALPRNPCSVPAPSHIGSIFIVDFYDPAFKDATMVSLPMYDHEGNFLGAPQWTMERMKQLLKEADFE